MKLKTSLLFSCLMTTVLLCPTAVCKPAQESAPTPDIRLFVREIDARNVERTIRRLVSFGTRNTLSSQSDSARGVGAARDWIYAEFQRISQESGGRLVVTKQSFEQPVAQRIPHPVRITNVVAMLPGERATPDQRVYVVSAHYDSICTNPTDSERDAPGADDDASGIAAVLEIARVMSKYRFDAPIVFLAVAGEEQGLYGSTYFAEQAKQKGWKIRGMFTNDIIGTGSNDPNAPSHKGSDVCARRMVRGKKSAQDEHSVRVFSEGIPSTETSAEANTRRSIGGENDAPSRQLARFIQEVATRYVRSMKVRLIYRRDRYLRGGDHIPFLERGFPAVRFTEPNEDFHHQHQNVRTENGIVYGDLPEFVDYDYVAQVARVNAAALAVLALAPASPDDVGLVTRQLTNDTELQWRANTEPDLSGYEIVWRDTTSPVWTNSLGVGKVTDYTVKGLSKDNYIFGVRAVNRRGYRSPVTFPHPIR